MLNWIKQLLAPPVFEDQDKTRVAGLLNIILLATIVINVVYSPILLMILPNPVPSLVVDNILLLLEIGLLVLMRRGYVQVASILLSFLVWVYITVVLYSFGGVRSPALNGFIILVLIAGLLLGGRAALGFAGLSVASSLAILFVELNGILPPSFVPLTPVYLWSGLFMVLIATATLLYLAIASLNDALENTRRNERTLAERNRELQTSRDLREARARQQAAVAGLGQRALASSANLPYLFDEAAALVAQVLQVEYSKVLELLPDGEALLLRAGVGWQEGLVGHRMVEGGLDSQAGYTLLSNEPVIVEDFRIETRFSGPPLLRDHGVVSGISVIIQGQEQSFGILGAHTTKRRIFTKDDIHFLQAVANVLAQAIERRQAEEALRRSEERFRSLSENALDIITVLDKDGTIRYESPSIERALGYAPDELIYQNVFEFVHPDDLPQVMEVFTQRSQISGPAPSLELRFRHKNGSWRILEVIGNNMLDDPVIAGIVINSRDITERKQLEEQLRQAQKMEAIGKLAGGVAHDFNNILTVITGYSELLLQRHPNEHDPERKDIEQIKEAGELATSLTRQLLAFSRQQVLQPRVLNLNTVVADLSRMLRRLIGEDIDLVTILNGELGQVKADPGQIEQVMLNLVINARDAMPQGGKLTIETANIDLDEDYARRHLEVEPGPYVMLAVSDTGIGMDAETQSHLFEPFFTTKGLGEGTGLGLATVHGIVNQSGGHIWVYSEPGQGTTFKIYLPRVEETVELSDQDQALTESLRGVETILLVEDEKMVRELIRHALLENGYTVLEARDGEEALQLSEQYEGPIHLLLTDVIMPGGLSGHQLAKRLVLRRSEIRVLYISGNTDNAIVQHEVLDPGTNFLQKPFAPDTLVSKVRGVLDAPQSK